MFGRGHMSRRAPYNESYRGGHMKRGTYNTMEGNTTAGKSRLPTMESKPMGQNKLSTCRSRPSGAKSFASTPYLRTQNDYQSFHQYNGMKVKNLFVNDALRLKRRNLDVPEKLSRENSFSTTAGRVTNTDKNNAVSYGKSYQESSYVRPQVGEMRPPRFVNGRSNYGNLRRNFNNVYNNKNGRGVSNSTAVHHKYPTTSTQNEEKSFLPGKSDYISYYISPRADYNYSKYYKKGSKSSDGRTYQPGVTKVPGMYDSTATNENYYNNCYENYYKQNSYKPSNREFNYDYPESRTRNYKQSTDRRRSYDHNIRSYDYAEEFDCYDSKLNQNSYGWNESLYYPTPKAVEPEMYRFDEEQSKYWDELYDDKLYKSTSLRPSYSAKPDSYEFIRREWVTSRQPQLNREKIAKNSIVDMKMKTYTTKRASAPNKYDEYHVLGPQSGQNPHFSGYRPMQKPFVKKREPSHNYYGRGDFHRASRISRAPLRKNLTTKSTAQTTKVKVDCKESISQEEEICSQDIEEISNKNVISCDEVETKNEDVVDECQSSKFEESEESEPVCQALNMVTSVTEATKKKITKIKDQLNEEKISTVPLVIVVGKDTSLTQDYVRKINKALNIEVEFKIDPIEYNDKKVNENGARKKRTLPLKKNLPHGKKMVVYSSDRKQQSGVKERRSNHSQSIKSTETVKSNKLSSKIIIKGNTNDESQKQNSESALKITENNQQNRISVVSSIQSEDNDIKEITFKSPEDQEEIKTNIELETDKKWTIREVSQSESGKDSVERFNDQVSDISPISLIIPISPISAISPIRKEIDTKCETKTFKDNEKEQLSIKTSSPKENENFRWSLMVSTCENLSTNLENNSSCSNKVLPLGNQSYENNEETRNKSDCKKKNVSFDSKEVSLIVEKSENNSSVESMKSVKFEDNLEESFVLDRVAELGATSCSSSETEFNTDLRADAPIWIPGPQDSSERTNSGTKVKNNIQNRQSTPYFRPKKISLTSSIKEESPLEKLSLLKEFID